MGSAPTCSPRKQRLHVVGLTGSIGMGKSTAGHVLARHGIPVHDADAAVRALLTPGGEAERAVARAFPEVVTERGIDRAALAERVFADRGALRRLERILHPRTHRMAERFVHKHRLRRTPVVALEIPLLYETGSERLCDEVVVVSAPGFIQRRRVLARPGMTASKLNAIARRQLPDCVKRRRAGRVVQTGLGTWRTRRQLMTLFHVQQEDRRA